MNIARHSLLILFLCVLTCPAAAQDPTFGGLFNPSTSVPPGITDEDPISLQQAVESILDQLRMQDRAAFEAVKTYLLTQYTQGGQLALTSQHGADNQLQIDQVGFSNIAIITQRGNRNTTELEQIGNDNVYGSWLIGHDNELDVHQLGDRNAYVFGFVGDGLDHTVFQQGNDIRAAQFGVGSLPFGIQQRGNNMEVVIQHNTFGQ